MSNSSKQLAESKLVLIYLLYKMNLPISTFYMQEFALESECMDYFSLSNYLAELVESGYISKTTENNKTIYIITDEGYRILNLFKNLIPEYIKEKVNDYVEKNKKQLKKELDVTAIYEQIDKNEFEIKCGAYENGIPIMNINFKVVNKKYAKIICENWKKNAPFYYISFMKSLLEGNEDDK